jgi:hypothetical protein
MEHEAGPLETLQTLIAHLEDAATYARDMDQSGYDKARVAALSSPEISDSLPDLVKKYRSLGQFRAYMQTLGGYKERRAALHQAFEPVFDVVEAHARRRTADVARYDSGDADGREANSDQDEYDVFISHASEDKESFARPLAEALRARGLKVWFDEFTLKVGDSLSKSIDAGLMRSRFGVVILSRDFFAKRWPERELRALLTRETQAGRRLTLPIWHNISAADVAQYSALLADVVALQTSVGVGRVADDLVSIVRGDIAMPVSPVVLPAANLQGATADVPSTKDTYVGLGGYNSPPNDIRELRPEFAAVQPYIDFRFTNHQSIGGGWAVNWQADNLGAGTARNIKIFLPGLSIESISTLRKEEQYKNGTRADHKRAFSLPNDVIAAVVIEFEDIYGLAYRQYGRLEQHRVPSDAFFLFQVAGLGAPYPVKARIIPEQEPASWTLASP